MRPPDYALDFVRFAIEGSTLEHPIIVSARIRPDWLLAVAAELDVLDLTLTEAIARFAG